MTDVQIGRVPEQFTGPVGMVKDCETLCIRLDVAVESRQSHHAEPKATDLWAVTAEGCSWKRHDSSSFGSFEPRFDDCINTTLVEARGEGNVGYTIH